MNKQKKKHITLMIQSDNKRTAKCFQVGQTGKAYFPYKPYPQQENLIQILQQTIKSGRNALIQSPTGTGKTLCLLVGAISGLMQIETKRVKIYYLTRTHSQISQVIQELKKIPYKCRVNIIASRQQLCINKNLSQVKGRVLDKACQDLCNKKLCNYKDFQQTQIDEILEINQLKQLGKKKFFCPYYHSKQSTQKSQITILPFNYLLDQNLVRKNPLNLKDSIILFDQAHNIDNVAQQGSSLALTQQIVFNSLIQIQNLTKSIKSKFLHQNFAQKSQQISQLERVSEFIQNFRYKLKNTQQQYFYSKSQIIETIQRLTTSKQSNDCYIDGLDLGNFRQYLSDWDKIIKLFHKKSVFAENFQNFYYVFQKIFEILSEDKVDSYSVYITGKQGKSISFQCLNPALAFNTIKQTKPRSIILSSGTLSPLDDWDLDLEINFEDKVIIDSFITQKQLLSAIIAQEQNGATYDFSFQGKHNQPQYQNLVRTLQRLEKIISEGIVVAFSNYEIMEKTIKLCQNIKKPVYYQKKNNSVQSIYKEYSEACKKEGALLFIIMRGRFSQGINFSQQLCRCLIVVGVPFLPLKERRISQKKAYLQRKRGKLAAESWYITQTIRTLNQTLGRVIRNKKDYGIILLFDHRFLRLQINQKLPQWFKNSLKYISSKSIFQQIQRFMQEQPWLNQTQNINTVTVKQLKTRQKKNQKTLEQLIQFSTPGKNKLKHRQKILMIEKESNSLMINSVEEERVVQFKIPDKSISYFIQEQELQQLKQESIEIKPQKIIFPQKKQKKLLDSFINKFN